VARGVFLARGAAASDAPARDTGGVEARFARAPACVLDGVVCGAPPTSIACASEPLVVVPSPPERGPPPVGGEGGIGVAKPIYKKGGQVSPALCEPLAELSSVACTWNGVCPLATAVGVWRATAGFRVSRAGATA
jgi:hypothetical protein